MGNPIIGDYLTYGDFLIQVYQLRYSVASIMPSLQPPMTNEVSVTSSLLHNARRCLLSYNTFGLFLSICYVVSVVLTH